MATIFLFFSFALLKPLTRTSVMINMEQLKERECQRSVCAVDVYIYLSVYRSRISWKRGMFMACPPMNVQTVTSDASRGRQVKSSLP